MPELISVLMADIPNSGALWEHQYADMAQAVSCYEELALQCTVTNGGRVLKSRGENDGLFLVFASAANAACCAIELQRNLLSPNWVHGIQLGVRMAIHCGEAQHRDGDYFGPTVNRCARLRGAAAPGQVLISLAAATLLEGQLQPDFTLKNLGFVSLRDLRAEEVWQLWAPGLTEDFHGQSFTHAEDSTNLPRATTSFIGRGQEVARVRELLRSSRLVTLVGTGGTGKTRLALHAVPDLACSFANGIWLTEFAPIADEKLLVQAVLASIGQEGSSELDAERALVRCIGTSSILMVWDNCEHLVDAVAVLAERVLSSCRNVKILITSREPLQIAGEQVFRIPGLIVPPKNAGYHAGQPLPDSLKLFQDRAQAVRPGFTINIGNFNAIMQICQRLDGIPLAIELAAARIRAMGPEQVATRLGDRFRLLTGGSRTALPRHQTLRAMIDWSFNLLTPSERETLCRLSIFTGSWHINAAEAICCSDSLPEREIMDFVVSLTDKSLVVCAEDSGRYQLLETIRQYASDRLLEASGPAVQEELRVRHNRWYVTKTEGAQGVESAGYDASAWDSIDADYDNLRAVLERSIHDGSEDDIVSGIRIASALVPYWQSRYLVSEGREYCDRLLNVINSGMYRHESASLLVANGTLCWSQGDYSKAKTLAARACEIARSKQDKQNEAAALYTLALISADRGDYDSAKRLCRECYDIYLQAGDRRGMAQGTCFLGYCAFETADYQNARVLTERGIELQLELGIVPAYTRNTLGSILANLGDYEGSLSQYNQSYEWFLSSHNERGCAHCLHCIGGLLISKGDPQEGLDRLERSLKIFRALGDMHSAVTVLLDTAGALLDQGKVEMAVTASRECIELCCTLDSVLTSLRAIRQYAFILQAKGRNVEAAFLAIFSREKLVALKLASETSNECELEETFEDALSSLSIDQRQRLCARALESNIDSVLATILDHDLQRGSVTTNLLQLDSTPL